MKAKETGGLSIPGREDGAAGWTGRGSPKDKRTNRRQHHPMKGEIMKKQTLAAATALSLLFAASQAEALSIEDTYWGAGEANTVNHGTGTSAGTSGDVYDPLNQGYDISGMDVSISNGLLTVKIYSNVDDYFGKWLSNASTMAAPGSLFLSTDGWNPAGDAPNYGADGKNSTVTAGIIAVNDGEDWEYAVTLDNFNASAWYDCFSSGRSTRYRYGTENNSLWCCSWFFCSDDDWVF